MPPSSTTWRSIELFVNKFERSIYEDYVSFGAGDEDKVFELYTKSKQWLMEGGFNLRKFVTNCSYLHERIDRLECSSAAHKPTCHTSTSLEDESYVKRTLGDSQGNLEGLKVLGVLEPHRRHSCVRQSPHLQVSHRDGAYKM